MGKIEKKEVEYRNIALSFGSDASALAINAFNEGYLLGVKHAKKVLGDDDEN